MSRLFAIGDIHGCDVALAALLQWMSPTADDIVVTLGDYIDRGPNSRGVVDQLIALNQRTQWVGILGNHEEMMLDVIEGRLPYMEWIKHGGVETLDSYGFDGTMDFLPVEHREFYASLGDYFETDGFFFTHANFDGDVPLDQQSVDALRWRSLIQSVPMPHLSGKIGVVGHTAARDGEVVQGGHYFCIDTYCYGGGWLSALDLVNNHLYQVDRDGNRRGG